MQQSASMKSFQPPLSGWFVLMSKLHWNVDQYLPNYTLQHPRRQTVSILKTVYHQSARTAQRNFLAFSCTQIQSSPDHVIPPRNTPNLNGNTPQVVSAADRAISADCWSVLWPQLYAERGSTREQRAFQTGHRHIGRTLTTACSGVRATCLAHLILTYGEAHKLRRCSSLVPDPVVTPQPSAPGPQSLIALHGFRQNFDCISALKIPKPVSFCLTLINRNRNSKRPSSWEANSRPSRQNISRLL